MPVVFSAYLSGVTVPHTEICWPRSCCVRISGHICEGLSSPFAQATAPFDGCRISGMKMGCWPVGTCCWDNFWLPSSIVRGPSMPMRMVCPANAASVRGQIARFPQPFASSEMGESMDTDLLPELSSETWVASTLLDGMPADLLPAGADLDLIVASRQHRTLATVREWVQSGNVPLWADCAGLSPELRCWRLQVGNLSIDMDGRLWRRPAPPSGASQLVVPHSERRDMIRRFHDSLFAGHLGVSRTVFHLQSRVYWPGLRMYKRTWRPVLSVWHVNFHVHGGHPWDMSQWVIDGIERRWTY